MYNSRKFLMFFLIASVLLQPVLLISDEGEHTPIKRKRYGAPIATSIGVAGKLDWDSNDNLVITLPSSRTLLVSTKKDAESISEELQALVGKAVEIEGTLSKNGAKELILAEGVKEIAKFNCEYSVTFLNSDKMGDAVKKIKQIPGVTITYLSHESPNLILCSDFNQSFLKKSFDQAGIEGLKDIKSTTYSKPATAKNPIISGKARLSDFEKAGELIVSLHDGGDVEEVVSLAKKLGLKPRPGLKGTPYFSAKLPKNVSAETLLKLVKHKDVASLTPNSKLPISTD